MFDGFVRSAARAPDRHAVEVRGETLTYRELEERAKSIAATLTALATGDGPPLTAVFTNRTGTGFASVLGVLLRGHGYVPLNVRFPADRCKYMVEHTRCRALVVDSESLSQLDELMALLEEPMVLLLPDVDDVAPYAERWPTHAVYGRADLRPASEWREPQGVRPDDIAYILFTSGSTGRPKGVMVSHRKVEAFVAAMVDR